MALVALVLFHNLFAVDDVNARSGRQHATALQVVSLIFFLGLHGGSFDTCCLALAHKVPNACAPSVGVQQDILPE